MEKFKAFCKRKNIEVSAKRYGIDALGAMAQGLFCSLLIGTIIKTLGAQLGVPFLTDIGTYAMSVSGPAMAIAIGYALKADPMVLFSLAAVGWAANAEGGAGGPLAVLVTAIIAAEFGKAVSKETTLGFMNDKYPDSDYETFWPADVHFIGKEIVRFHSIIWPAMLMSMDMPLPKHVYGHGWLLLDGGKMSKSKGNVVDPYLLAERYSADALRYFLLRDFPFGSDGNFSNELLINRINMDLANDLGNLLSRTTAMADKYFGGNLPIEQDEGPEDAALLEKARGLRDRYEADMEAYAFQNALADVFEVIDNANKYIDATAPWVLAKSEDSKPRLARVLYNLAETLRICTVLLQPFMPTTCEKIFAQLNVEADGKTWDSAAAFGTLPVNATLHKGENIFPRIDAAKELAELEALEAAQKAAAQAANAPAEQKEEKPAESGAASAEFIGEHEEEITFDDFCKVELRVAEVRACERMKESKKLLHLTVFDGERERCILSGIAKWFAPEDLIGKKIGIVANLAPRPMMKGKYVSEGMIFAADTDVDGGCSIAFFPDNTPAGARIH